MHRSLSILQYSTRYRHIRQSDVWHPKISRLSNRYIPLLLRNKSLNLVLWTQIKFQENLSILYWEFGDRKQIKFHSRYFFVISSLYSYQMHTYTTIVKDWLITIDLSRFGRWRDRNRKKLACFCNFPGSSDFLSCIDMTCRRWDWETEDRWTDSAHKLRKRTFYINNVRTVHS